MKTPWRWLILLGLTCSTGVVCAAAQPDKPVALGGGPPLRTGAKIREQSEVRVDVGKTRQEIGKDITEVGTHFVRRVHLMRRMIGGAAEEVEVREFYQDSCNFVGPAPPPEANELINTLGSKTLRARKKSGRWSYTMLQGTATLVDQKLIDEMGFTEDLLDILPACIGTGSRKVGDTWKTDMPAPRGKAYGWIVPESLESTLVSVEEKPDGPHATIAITGKFKMERPMNFNARMEITFTATVVRRLSDMLDLDTRITGRFLTVAASVTDKRVPISLTYDFPFTITRTRKFEDK